MSTGKQNLAQLPDTVASRIHSHLPQTGGQFVEHSRLKIILGINIGLYITDACWEMFKNTVHKNQQYWSQTKCIDDVQVQDQLHNHDGEVDKLKSTKKEVINPRSDTK